MASASRLHRRSGHGTASSPQIDAKGGDKLEAATAHLARKLVYGPYR